VNWASRRVVPEMLSRVEIAQAVLDRFGGMRLDWKTADCGRLAGYALRLAGANPRMSRFTGYTNEIGARRRLLKAGFKDLPAVLDDLGLARIPPLMVMAGDIVGLPGLGEWTALGVALGNRKVLMFAPDGVCRSAELPAEVLAVTLAWRVTPKPRVAR
jgi:hypothetical protein